MDIYICDIGQPPLGQPPPPALQAPAMPQAPEAQGEAAAATLALKVENCFSGRAAPHLGHLAGRSWLLRASVSNA